MIDETFTLQELQGVTALKKNGNVCLCPFRTPYFTPSPIQGQMNINQPICSSGCMFFNEMDNKIQLNGVDHKMVFLHCVKTEFYIKDNGE